MQSQATLTLRDIPLDLRRRDYSSARSKCDSALKSLEALDSIPILLARAEAIRSLPDSDLEMALKDVKEAISINPQNPNSHLALGQVHQAMSIRTFDQGKAFCFNQSSSSALARLDSLSTGTKNLLKSSESSSLNIIFLPKEILETILLPLDPSQKAKCLRVSKDWRNHLTSQLTLWRSIKLNQRYTTSETFLKSSPLNLFASMSKNTLTWVHVELGYRASQTVVESCFDVLEKSSQTLNTLKFTGRTRNFTCLTNVLSLASKCNNLEELHFDVYESVEPSDDDYSQDPDEGEEEYYERIEKEKEVECREDVYLDGLKMKCRPSTVNLSCSLLARLELGDDLKVFAKARSITLSLSNDAGITRSELVNLLRTSSQSLETLSIKQEDYSSLAQEKEIEEVQATTLDPVQLPNLKKIEIKRSTSLYFTDIDLRKKDPIKINAPNLSREASWVYLPNLIFNQGQDLAVRPPKAGSWVYRTELQ